MRYKLMSQHELHQPGDLVGEGHCREDSLDIQSFLERKSQENRLFLAIGTWSVEGIK